MCVPFVCVCRYNSAVEEKVRVMRERDEARDEASAYHAERDIAAREKTSVRNTQTHACALTHTHTHSHTRAHTHALSLWLHPRRAASHSMHG